MSTAPFVHGTYAGWNQHNRRGERPCQRCMDAQAEYMRTRRAGDPIARRQDKWWNHTRRTALDRLAREYPERFAEILAEVRREERPDRP